MAVWKTAPNTFFLKAGEAMQCEVGFGGEWKGPQFMQAVHETFSDGSGDTHILLMQWNGVANQAVFGGPARRFYACGVHNTGTVDVSFHLEGGGVA